MTVSAAITFTQGVTTSSPGEALLVSSSGVGTPVTAANGSDIGVQTWKWEMIDVPPGSSVPTGTVGTSPSFTFTPDKTGCYLMRLTVSDGIVGGSTSIDLRAFGVREISGILVPPFGASTDIDNGIAGSLNWADSSLLGGAQNKRGWAPYMEQFIRTGGRDQCAAVKTGNYTANVNEIVPFDSTAGTFTLKFPASPVAGNNCSFVDVGGKAGIAGHQVEINGNGKNFVWIDQSLILVQQLTQANYGSQTWTYTGTIWSLR